MIYDFLSKNNKNYFYINSPVWAAIPKIRDIYRKIVYLKSVDRNELVIAKNLVEKYVKDNSGFSRIGLQFDFEPYGNS